MLRTGELSWRDLAVLVKHLPEESAYRREIAGHPWRVSDVLLTSVVNLLRLLTWQWGGKGKQPKPIYLPGTEPENADKTWGVKPRPIEEMKRLLGW